MSPQPHDETLHPREQSGKFAVRPTVDAAGGLDALAATPHTWTVSEEDPDVEWLSGERAFASVSHERVAIDGSGDYDLPHTQSRYQWEVADNDTGRAIASGTARDAGQARVEASAALELAHQPGAGS